MSDPVSSKYHFLQLISSNELSQSWIAESSKGGARSFVKTENPESQIPADEKRNILLNSYTCQRGIRSPRILTASGKFLENGRVFIEYPLFDTARWHILTAEELLTNADRLLPELFLTVDYLHSLQFVHCDLKLGNFIIGPLDRNGIPCVRIIDLDFLCEVGSSPRAKIVGSPDHIAPEILANETILAQSDNFSLGVMLRKALDGTEGSSAGLNKKLISFANELVSPDPMHRPRVLLDAQLKHQLIDADEHALLERRLLNITLLNRFREVSSRQIDNPGIQKSILDPCKILGIRPELSESLGMIKRASKRHAFSLVKRITLESDVRRLGEYWFVLPADKLVTRVYNEGSEAIGGTLIIPEESSIVSSRIAIEATSAARQLVEKGALQPALLTYQAVIAAQRSRRIALDPELYERILMETALLLMQMGYRKSGVGLLDEVHATQNTEGRIDLELLYQLIYRSFALSSEDHVASLASCGITEARRVGSTEMELVFESMAIFVRCLRSEYEALDESIQALEKRAGSASYPRLVAMIQYIRGYAKFIQGQLAEAAEEFRKSLKTSSESQLENEAIRAALGLAQSLSQLYRIEDTIKIAKTVPSMEVFKKSERWREGTVFRLLSLCYIRLGDYRKAEYWLNRVWTGNVSEADPPSCALYYYGLIALEKGRGSLEQAKAAAAIALELTGDTMVALTEGHIYLALAEIACFEGDSLRLSEYAEKSRSVFERISNLRSIRELDLVIATHLRFNTDEDSPDLLPLLRDLVMHHAFWDAAYCLFYMLMDEDMSRYGQVTTELNALKPLVDAAEMPICASLKALWPMMSEKLPSDQTLTALKSGYRLLSTAGRIYAAMIVCRRIAREYGKQGQSKLRLKFLKQAQKHAFQLSNRPMIDRLQAEIDLVDRPEEDRGRMVASLLSISEILKHIADYDRSLEQLVRFAIDQTGAERGVILEKRPQSDELRVKSFVNCDDESLRDIADISMRVPSRVAQEHEALILENALTDKRTKEYKSIIAHNILSVICLPIMHDNNLLGVLYLDHHTIPALFEEDDITYIRSIANFIGMMLSAISSYRDLHIENRQLVEDISRQIGPHQFITNDPKMHQLFARMPQIARLSMPVLVLGESGTGKEIVAEMIHRLSDRKDRPLVKLNCSALPESMLEAELFGVANNTATGVAGREGKFAAADGSTLFLDEIGDMSLTAQAKILRVVEYQEFEKLGSNKMLKTDIRFIYATNKNLLKMVEEGTFRRDLYHRISGYTFEIPPLRERSGDIWVLVTHFVEHFSQGHRPPVFAPETRLALQAYEWRGNVRELLFLVRQLCADYAGEKVRPADLPEAIRTALTDPSRKKDREEQALRLMLQDALKRFDGNRRKAAASVNMPYATFVRKIEKFGLKD